MAGLTSRGGHSAQVNMQLLLNGNSIRIEQMGPDFLIVKQPFNHPPTDASLVLQVDDSKRVWNVRLPQGISAASNRIALGNGP